MRIDKPGFSHWFFASILAVCLASLTERYMVADLLSPYLPLHVTATVGYLFGGVALARGIRLLVSTGGSVWGVVVATCAACVFIILSFVAYLNVGQRGAAWLDPARWSERDELQQPELVLETLDIRPGSTVADIGAGGGYFTFRIANQVGQDGRVYAVDIDTVCVRALRETAMELGADNVVSSLCTPSDPELPKGVFDLILLVDTLDSHMLVADYLTRLREYLGANGRVAVIIGRDDLNSDSIPAGDMERYAAESGYDIVERPDFLVYQDFYILRMGQLP